MELVVIPPRTVSGGGGATIATQDEGISVDAAATTLNFVGAGVVATDAGSGVTTVTIAGGGTPGGSDTQIQYNDGGAFNGDSRLAFNETTKVTTGQWAVDSNAINVQTGTSYSLQASDNGKLITLDNSSAITLTVPTGLGAGFNCMFEQLNATGTVTINPSGTTVESLGGFLSTAGRYSVVSLIARASNTFVAMGNLA